MKKIILLSLLFASSTVFANDDFTETCLNRYRDATDTLLYYAESYNQSEITGGQLLAEFAAIESQIGVKRLVCAFEPAEIKECVRLYKKQYHKIRDNIDVLEIAKGNQSRIRVGRAEIGLAAIDLICGTR